MKQKNLSDCLKVSHGDIDEIRATHTLDKKLIGDKQVKYVSSIQTNFLVECLD